MRSATVDRRLGGHEVVGNDDLEVQLLEQPGQQEEGGALVHGLKFWPRMPLNATQLI